MQKITVTTFPAVPDFAQGLVRDLRARWALEEAGLAYDVALVEDRASAAYRRVQPFGLVPAFEADGLEMFESGAIVQLIADDHDVLMPKDRPGRARTLSWMYAALNTVELPVWELFLIDVAHAGEDWAKVRRPGVEAVVRTRLADLATALGERAYLAGPFSAADILMATVLRFLRHTDLVAETPALAAYLARCEARPAFQKALADQMAVYAPETAAA